MTIEQFVKHIEQLNKQHQQSLDGVQSDTHSTSMIRVDQLRSELVRLKDMLKLALERKSS